jgi:hypothetical protein
MAVPLLIVWRLDHLDWTLFVAFGAFTAVYGRHQTYRDRARMQLGAGLAIVASITLGTAVGTVAPGSFLAVAAMMLVSAAGYLLSRKNGWLPVGSIFVVFAVGATSAFAQPISSIPVAFILCALSMLFAVGLGQAGRLFPAGREAPKAPAPRALSWTALFADHRVRVDLVRFAAGPLIAGSIATLLGIGHPYWAAVSATVPLSGSTARAQLVRAVHRFSGTLVGVVIALAVLSTQPTHGVMIAIVIALQGVVELFVLRNYGVAVIALTPLALILSHIASPVAIPQLAGDRALETTIGVAVAVAVTVASEPWRRADRARVKRSGE